MIRQTSRTFCMVLAFWLMAAAQLGAQDDRRRTAAAHFAQGVQHAKAGAYAAALAEFEAADALVQHPSTVYNIAVAQAGLGNGSAAIATLRRYLALTSRQQDGTRYEAAVILLRDLQHPQPTPTQARSKGANRNARDKAPPVRLTVIAFPYGEVSVNGMAMGSSPLTIELDAGHHRITVGRALGQPELAAEVSLDPGEQRRLVLPWARADLVPPEDRTAFERL